MDRVELARQIAADLHRQALSDGHDPWHPYEFALAEARRRGFDVEPTAADSILLDGGRATAIAADGLILHENIGTPFEQAFLVAHEIGHVELGDDFDDEPAREIDPARAVEASPVGIDRVVDRIVRFLDRVRRLVRLGDDRDLRQLPAAAQGIDAVRLMTIHGAKGLEFRIVHLPGLNADTIPRRPSVPPCPPPDGMVEGTEGPALDALRAGQAEEQECLFYVAMLRVRDRLFLYAPTQKSNGHKWRADPADFASEWKLRSRAWAQSQTLVFE